MAYLDMNVSPSECTEENFTMLSKLSEEDNRLFANLSPLDPLDLKRTDRCSKEQSVSRRPDLNREAGWDRGRRQRSRRQNVRDALDRLRTRLEGRLEVPTPRVATRPSRAAHKRRLDGKRRRSATKRLRGSVDRDD